MLSVSEPATGMADLGRGGVDVLLPCCNEEIAFAKDLAH
jgi:hypothetical protein